MSTPTPVGSSERIESIDVILGIALLGIFIMNTPYFSTSMFAGADGTHLFNASYDRIAADARDLLFSGKFNSMFSALFAIGFTIQYSRLQAADPSRATGIYVRRLLVLLGFGIIHGYFIWIGDILHTYALLGLVLVLGFNRLSDRWIWAAFALTMVVPPVINLVRLPLMTPEFMQHQLAVMKSFEASTNQAFGHGTFVQMVRENMKVFEFGYLDPLALFYVCGILLLLQKPAWKQRLSCFALTYGRMP